MKSINLSAPVYADLSNSFIEFSLINIKLCIGSLQIKSLGNFDYLLDNDPNIFNYPNGYHASRLFWSTKNARQKTIYHLYIEIEQTYHHDKLNHQTIEYPLTNKQIYLEQLYKTCEKYFNKFKKTENKSSLIISEKISIDTKTLRNLFNNNSFKSSNLSRFALAILEAFQLNDSTCIPQIDGNLDDNDQDYLISSSIINSIIEQIVNKNSISSDELIQLYHQWLISKYGRIKFTIISDDGYKIISDNLDNAWLTIVNLVRECRDDMNLTHLSMTNDELNGHNIFGLTKSIIKIILNSNNQEQINTIILSNNNNNNNNNSNCLVKKKTNNKKNFLPNSRLNIYQRKSSQRQRFNWLLNPNRKIEYALNTFEIDEALAYTR